MTAELKTLNDAFLDELRDAFTLLGETASRKPCAGMAGILEEGNEIVEDDEFEPEAINVETAEA